MNTSAFDLAGTSGLLAAQLLTALFLAILFLQSGLDKVTDWSGNLSWLTGHFAKTPLKNVVPLLLATVTLAELAAGLCSAAGVIQLWRGDTRVALLGAVLSALSLVMLFFGQRVAKDYAGAATLAGYFVVAIGAILLFA